MIFIFSTYTGHDHRSPGLILKVTGQIPRSMQKWVCIACVVHTCQMVWKDVVVQKSGSTYIIALSSDNERATLTGNTYRKYGGLGVRYASWQIDRYTDTLITTPGTPLGWSKIQQGNKYDQPYTHTHPFNGPFSGTTQVSRYQKGKTNLDFTEARDGEWQWHQLGHMQVCTLLQTDNHASTQPLKFLQAGCPSCHPTNSVKALKATNMINHNWNKLKCSKSASKSSRRKACLMTTTRSWRGRASTGFSGCQPRILQIILSQYNYNIYIQ